MTIRPKKQLLANKKGFTFIETILYIALLTIVMGAFFSYGWNIIGLRTKISTIRETSATASFVRERLKREIRMAIDVDHGQSVFESVPGKIKLTTLDGDVTIESSDDKISLARGTDPAQFLVGDNVRIRNFELTEQVSDEGKVQYVGFSFVAEAYYPEAANRSEYQYSVPVNSGAELRSQ